MNLLLALIIEIGAICLLLQLWLFWQSVKARREQYECGLVVPRPGLEWNGKEYVVVPPSPEVLRLAGLNSQ